MAEAAADPDVLGLILLGSRSVGDSSILYARRPSMAKLIYAAITSLDGYITDEHGSIDWTVPSVTFMAV